MFYGQCSEICGILHSSMPIVIESVSLEKFLAWLDAQSLAAFSPLLLSPARFSLSINKKASQRNLYTKTGDNPSYIKLNKTQNI